MKQLNDSALGVARIDREVSEAPHAPWWDHEGLKDEFNHYPVNPRAGILRCLLEYSRLVEPALVGSVALRVVALPAVKTGT